MANDKIIVVTPDNWQTDVIASELPVLVDFWAEWCGPCRAIAPVLDQLADELDGKLKIAKVDVDQHQALAGQFHVQSIPTLLVIKGGAVVEQMVGAMSKPAMVAKLEAHL